jgi:hypothetical protein
MKQMTRFLIEEQRRHKDATGNFTVLVNDIRLACKRIATLIGKGALADARGRHGFGGDGRTLRDPGGVPARALSAAVRPARRRSER